MTNESGARTRLSSRAERSGVEGPRYCKLHALMLRARLLQLRGPSPSARARDDNVRAGPGKCGELYFATAALRWRRDRVRSAAGGLRGGHGGARAGVDRSRGDVAALQSRDSLRQICPIAAEREAYLDWCEEWAAQIQRLLQPNGSFFLNVGAAPSNPMLPHELVLRLRKFFVLQNTIHWVKSIALPNDEGAGDFARAFQADQFAALPERLP